MSILPGRGRFCPRRERFPGIKSSATAKHPCSGRKTRTKCITAAKYPHLGRKTGTKYTVSSKISSFRPQNRDKPRRQQQNILIQAAKPGQNASQQQNILI
jgi:hypothetical protein